MKNLALVIITLLSNLVIGQDLYVQTFGDTTSTPVIYLHGGPGYNSSTFEVTTALELANNDYFVVVYDRRGEGRSANNADYTFEQTHSDLLGIMDSLNIESTVLIGHSFGGMVAVTFAEKYQDRVQSIILVGAPVSLQESFKTIINSCEKIYTKNDDQENLSYISMLKEMDTTTVQYSSFCFMHAMQNGFYSTNNPTDKAKELYQLFQSDSILIKYAQQMGSKQPQGFWKNEAYTTIDLSTNINELIKSDTEIYGLYGKEDGLYSEEQVESLKKILGADRLKYLDNCSHSVFIDQQSKFIEYLNQWVK